MTKAEKNKIFKKRNGWYYSDGVKDFSQPLPSVTTILGNTLAKPGLDYWKLQQAVRVALEDPSLKEAEVIAESKVRGLKGATRGTGIHNIFAKMLKKEDYLCPEGYEEFIKGLILFFNENKPEVVFADKIIKSDKYGYAGSLDCVVKMKGELWLIDLKTGGSYPEHGLQLSAYNQCLKEEGIEVAHQAILLLEGDGFYTLKRMKNSLEIFLKIKDIWTWLHNKGE